MTTTRLATATLAALLAGTALCGCSNNSNTEQTTFTWQGTTLDVVNDNANMPVTVSSSNVKEVTVAVNTTAVGKSATTPAWTLTGNTLDLDTPCGKGYVGVCEGSYSLTVPIGTKVKINGTDTPVK